jgi:hypothetical protein
VAGSVAKSGADDEGQLRNLHSLDMAVERSPMHGGAYKAIRVCSLTKHEWATAGGM